MSSHAGLRAKVASRLKASVRTKVIEKFQSVGEIDSRHAFKLAQQYVDTLKFEELRDLHANGISLRKVHSRLSKINAKRQARIDQLSKGKRKKNEASNKPAELPASEQIEVARAASRSAARRKQKMDVWASMMAYDVEKKKQEDKETAERKRAELEAYRKNLAAQTLEKEKRRDRERREAEREARRINRDVRKFQREEARKQKDAMKYAARMKQEANDIEQVRQRRLAAEAEQEKKDLQLWSKKMAEDVRKMRLEQQRTKEKKKQEELELKKHIDKHNAHLRQLRLEEQEYFNSIQRESERRFKEETRKRREKKQARDAAIQAKVNRMNKIHQAHEELMTKQNKQEQLGRELTQARRDAEQRAKVEKRQAQEKAMFESIRQMKLQKELRRKQEEEEEEKFAAIMARDTEKYKQELEADKERKRKQIVDRRRELDELARREAALIKDREIPLAVLAINKPLLTKVQKANVGDVASYIQKVEEHSPGRRRRRRRRRRDEP